MPSSPSLAARMRWVQPRERLMVVAIAAMALILTLVMSGCGAAPFQSQSADHGTHSTGNKAGDQSPAAPTPDPVVMTPNVADGTTGVKVDTRVSVKAAHGTLDKVSLSYRGKDRDGMAKTIKVSGEINKEKSEWTASELLDPGAHYELAMKGISTSGDDVSTMETFSTDDLTLDEQIFPSLSPLSDTTVGTGMPVILKFDLPVKDKKSFEKHLHVTSSPKQVGSWHWYSPTEVHFRPKNYWQPGTKVTVSADLNGVLAGNGRYGQESRSASFTIGRSVVVKVNIPKKTTKVYIGGKLARTIPDSAGKPGFVTRSGHKLIMEKLPQTKMAAETIGIQKNDPNYFDLEVKYAMRVTTSGEFLHAAPWNSGLFGNVNGSHGCVGLSTSNAQWLFNTVEIGDPVIMTGSGRGLEQGNGWTDWDISWAKYKAGSALH